MSSNLPSPRLGVDFGTLVTVAVSESADGATTEMSSAVALDDDGVVVVGEVAERVLAAHPARGTRQLKRRFGDTTPVVLDGQAMLPDALVGAVLLAVVGPANIEASTSTLALTHPASWGGYKVELLQTIGSSFGFADVELIAEPVAAAHRYASAGRLSSGDNVAVYDLGATFDAAIVSMSESGPVLAGTAQSLEHCGGAEFDHLVFKHVAGALGSTFDELDRNDANVRDAVASLRSACAAAKHDLSISGDASVKVVLPGLDTTVRVTREEFETAMRPYITETLQALDRAIASAGIGPDDLVGVILSGGGSRIPLVAEMVAGHLGRPVFNDVDPKSVAAAGAVESISSRSSPQSTPFMSIADSSSASPRETPMSDQTTPPAESAENSPADGRSTPPPPPSAKKQGPSTAAKLVGGAVAAAAAVAAGVMYGDDIVDAASGDDDNDTAAAGQAGLPGADDAATSDEPFKSADQLEREATSAESMDVFDAPAPSDATVVVEPVTGPAGTPLVDAPAPVPGFTTNEASLRQGPHTDSGSAQGGDIASPASGSAGVHRPAPTPGTGSDDGADGAPSPATASPAPQPAAPIAPSTQPLPDPVDTEFETARATLLERLEDFEAPAGTSPEDAEQLRQELIEAVERFDPAPGQSTDEALADLRDDYDRRVQDFTQDQKIDALIQEAQRDNEADTPTQADAETPPAVPVDAADGIPDGGIPDGGIPDGGIPDGGIPDGGIPDGGIPDGPAESESFVLIADPHDRAEPASDDRADSAEPADVDAGSDDLSATEMLTIDVEPAAVLIGLDQPLEPAAVLIGLDQPLDPAAVLIGLDQPLDPAAILIGLDQPADGGLTDDFDLMIKEPGGDSLLEASDYLAPSARSFDVQADGLGEKAPLEVTDVRATYVPSGDQPVLIGDSGANLSSPIQPVDDVLGDVAVASIVGRAEQDLDGLVGLDVPIELDAPEAVADLIETDQVIAIMQIDADPIQVEAVIAPMYDEEPADFELADVDFATDIAGDITPASPDTLSFEP